MKNVNILNGLLLAGFALDTANLSFVTPGPIENQPQMTASLPELINVAERIIHIPKSKGTLLSGTFYASRLLWASQNKELYLYGDRVKVDMNTQKFTGNGKFSFINRIGYLVVDGTPVKLDETIKLTDKKYQLTQIDEAEGEKRYGDLGKGGVVEIKLAE